MNGERFTTKYAEERSRTDRVWAGNKAVKEYPLNLKK